MIYDISHKTSYVYSTPVSQSRHIAHLAPREVANQTTIRHGMMIEPAPNFQTEKEDYFGNPARWIDIDTKHDELVVHARSRMAVAAPDAIEPLATMPWNAVRTFLARPGTPRDIDVIRFLSPSRLTQTNADIERYASASFTRERPAIDAALDLMHRIHDEFEFDSSATDISTPLPEVLARRRGVCQDFSHLALACLRTMGVPARYVSGYILTHPPEGQQRLHGADASHAWISVWAPETGWVDMDPTNDQVPHTEHIAFAYGRDFDDVSPLRGVLHGGSDHAVSVDVDVLPVAPDDAATLLAPHA